MLAIRMMETSRLGETPPAIVILERQRIGYQPDTPSTIIALWNQFKDLFHKRTIRVVSDSVGYGFVLRGDGPSFVQTVDPSGPAADSGLRVGTIIQTVNGIDVLNLNHKETAKMILARRLGAVTLTVFELTDLKLA